MVVVGRRAEAAAAVAAEVGGMSLVCDITEEAEVESMIATVVDRCGSIDGMVNTAGFERSTPLKHLDAGLLREMIDVHLIGAVQVIRHAAAAMAETGGSIVSLSSFTAHTAARGLGAYAACKAGLEHLTRIAAVEYGPTGVRVNCVAPHLVETPMTEDIFANRLAIEAVRRRIPLGRLGTVSDVAGAIVFLLGDESAYITGQTIRLDGGAVSLPAAGDVAALAAAHPELLE